MRPLHESVELVIGEIELAAGIGPVGVRLAQRGGVVAVGSIEPDAAADVREAPGNRRLYAGRLQVEHRPHRQAILRAQGILARLAALLERCLERLSIEHRTLMLLDQLGLSYAEMAEVTSTETGTVKSRLSRARARVRDLLAGEPAWFSEPGDRRRRSDDQGWTSAAGQETETADGARDEPDGSTDHP